jgi:hypothetical protein
MSLRVSSRSCAAILHRQLQAPALRNQPALNVVEEIEELELAVKDKLAAVRQGTVEDNAKSSIACSLKPDRFPVAHE